MESKFQGRTYKYNPSTGELSVKDKSEINPEVLRHFQNLTRSIQARGFSLNMKYKEFDNYISILTSDQKNDLFHHIYNQYSYAGDSLKSYSDSKVKGPKLTTTEYFKVMAKLKRFERYLYIILQS